MVELLKLCVAISIRGYLKLWPSWTVLRIGVKFEGNQNRVHVGYLK